jgi:hypothetical protein
MACWFSSNDATINQVLLALTDTDSSNVYMALHIDGAAAGDPLKLTAKNTTSYTATTTNGFTDNKLELAVGVCRSATDRAVYLNADLANKGTSTNSSSAGAWDRTSIGDLARSGSPYYYTSGKIYIAYIWNRALSEQEIAQLYIEPFAMFDFGKPSWMRAIEAAGGFGQVIIIGD